MSLDPTLDYFRNIGQIGTQDAAQIVWSHATNSKRKLAEALKGPYHMIEADVLIRDQDPKEPIMAHPPENNSDITLQEWLEGIMTQNKGIKLDFKSLEAVAPSIALLEKVRGQLQGPLWLNADILVGPGGAKAPLEPQAFLNLIFHCLDDVTLSLGWTTKWGPNIDNPGYSWDMVREMEDVCQGLIHPVTFPVRAALLAQSFSQLEWLLQQSERYTLTVWTGSDDKFTIQDLLTYRNKFDKTRIYYDLPDSQRSDLYIASGKPN